MERIDLSQVGLRAANRRLQRREGDPSETAFEVVGLTGDGGFNMVMGELETARRLGLPLTIIVVNNAASGYVKALQHLMYGAGSYQSSDLVEVNYAKVADSLGCTGIRGHCRSGNGDCHENQRHDCKFTTHKILPKKLMFF